MLITMLSSYDMGCVVNKPEVFYNWFFIENIPNSCYGNRGPQSLVYTGFEL